MFTVQHIKLLCVFEIFHNKMVGKKMVFLRLLSPLLCFLSQILFTEVWAADPSLWLFPEHLHLLCQIIQVGNIPDSPLFLLLISYTLIYPHSPSLSLLSPTLMRTIPTLSPHHSQIANLIVLLPCSKFNSSPSTSRAQPELLSSRPFWSAPDSTFIEV